MKYALLLLLTLILFACGNDVQKVTISNENAFDVSHKLVTIRKEELKVKEDKLPTLKKEDGEFVPTQLIDIDKDGTWDQLIFQVSMVSQATVEFTVEEVSEEEYPKFKKQSQVYLGYSEARDNNYVSVSQNKRTKDHVPEDPPYTYQFEGPGWENNLVAFRSYFDVRNGKDIFGKTTEELVAQQIATGENYHELQDWGMDVLKVGQSLGSGSLAILANDSLIRLGETETAEFIKIEDGPIYSSLKLIYKGWDVLGKEYELEEHISLTANKRWFDNKVTLTTNNPADADTLVVGIVNFKEAHVESFDHANMQTLFTHGNQSENNDVLGMAIITSNAGFLSTSRVPKLKEGITNSELMYLKPEAGSYQYKFYAGWELENNDFADMETFKTYLKETMQELSSELKVTIQ